MSEIFVSYIFAGFYCKLNSDKFCKGIEDFCKGLEILSKFLLSFTIFIRYSGILQR